MNSLLDLGPLTEEVEIRGVKLTVRGLTAANLFKLFADFPDMQEALAQMGTTSSAILELAPDLFAKIIAIATGSPGDAAVIAKAQELGATDQMAILSAVQRLSFPQGFGPFVEQITRLMVPDTPSQPSVQGNSSPAPSNAALQTDSPGLTHGASPRVN
jgi:hypothetical protein